MKKFELDEEEAELIEVIRNLRRAYPNGYKEQLWLAQQIFDQLTDFL
ncbi:MAG: ArsR family transcriptional regulator [Bacteroides sp.]|nr:ArsR family transcriptional regulator [Bacteroides sp.]